MDRSPGIAVFGSSEALPADPLYGLARRAGALIAGHGYTVVTGGYGGVMAAASRGAREAGGATLGVTCALFSERTPNRWLADVRPTQDLFERTRVLIEHSAGFLVLDGRAGTLAELAFVWALDRAGCLDRRPVVLLSDRWERIFSEIARLRILDPSQHAITHVARSPEAAVDELVRRLVTPRSIP